MKSKYLFLFIAIFAVKFVTIDKAQAAYKSDAITMVDLNASKAKHYNSGGLITQEIKVWHGRVSIDDATQKSVDITSADFGTVLDVTITPEDDLCTVPVVRSYNTSAVVLDCYQLSTTSTTILSILTLNGASMSAASNLTGLYVNVQVTGY